MRTYDIAVIAGDGIGVEVVAEVAPIVAAAAERCGFQCRFESFAWGSKHYLDTGRMMPHLTRYRR